FLGRVDFLAVIALEAFFTGAERDQPVGARLNVLIGGFQRFVVEGVALCLFVARGPDHGFVGVVKRRPRKFGIGLVLRQTISLRTQKPRSCMIEPTRKML